MNESATTTSSIQKRRIIYLVFATIALLIIGLIYAWSLFAKPIGAEYADYKSMLSQVFQVSMLVFCISALFGAQIYKRISPRAAIFVAAISLGVGFVGTALLTSLSVWILFIFYGLFAAAGVGIAYNAIISLVNQWFPDRTGVSSGVMMMGFGISALAFGSLANAAFEVIDWPIVFIIIGVVGIVVLAAVGLVVRPAPTDIASQLGMKSTAVTVKDSPTKSQFILRTKTFWLYSIWSTFIVVCGLTLIGSNMQGAEVVGVGPIIAPLLVGTFSTMNGIGRIINGALFDRFGLLPVMILAAGIATLSMVGLALSFGLMSEGFSPFIYVVVVFLYGFAYGSAPVMGASFARRRFKASDFAKNLSIINCNIAVASVINLIIAAFLGAPDAGNGTVIYTLLAVLMALAMLSLLVFSRVYKKDIATINEELQ